MSFAVSSARLSPLVRTEERPNARRPGVGGVLAFAEAVRKDGRLALFTLLLTVCGFLALAAKGSAFGAGSTSSDENGPRAGVEASSTDRTTPAFGDTAALGVDGESLPDVDDVCERAEFEQGDEEWPKDRLATGSPKAANFEFSLAPDERFRHSVIPLVSRISELQDRPRGPPSLA